MMSLHAPSVSENESAGAVAGGVGGGTTEEAAGSGTGEGEGVRSGSVPQPQRGAGASWYDCTAGVLEAEAVEMLRRFYSRGNARAPNPQRPV